MMPMPSSEETKPPDLATTLALFAYRLGEIEKILNGVIVTQLAAHATDIQELKTEQARLQERMTIWNYALAAWSTLTGVLAGIFGKQP